MKYAIILFALVLQAPAAFGQTCTPFSAENHRIVVSVKLNGYGPYPFVLDTGTQMTIIDLSMAHTLHLVNKPGVLVVGGMTARGVANTTQLKTVEFAQGTVKDMKVMVYDLSKLHSKADVKVLGILGQDFLEHFNVLLNNKESCISLNVL